MRLPLPHARAKALALFFAQIGPAWAKVAVHAPLPAVVQAFVQARSPTRATRKHGKADADEQQRPEQIHPRGVDEAIVLEQPEDAKDDEDERNNAHGSLQEKMLAAWALNDEITVFGAQPRAQGKHGVALAREQGVLRHAPLRGHGGE